MEPSQNNEEKLERLREAMYSRTLSEKLKERERRTLSPEAEGVGDDWGRPEPGNPSAIIAPATIGLARNILWWLLGIAVVFFIGAVGFFIYFFTFGGGSQSASSANIDISVAGPAQITGGAPTELQISITNRNRTSLNLSQLILTYPDGTRSTTDLTTPLPEMRIDLGSVAPGETKRGVVSAVFEGTQGTTQNVQVELDYRLPGSSAIFTASNNYTLNFASSPLSISTTGNAQTISGQPVTFTINVTSNTTAPVADTLLSVDYPFGFKFGSATPAPIGGGATSTSALWQLGNLLPGQTSSIVVRGTLSGAPGDTRVFTIRAGTRPSVASSTISTVLASNPFSMQISSSFLGLQIATAGSTDKTVVVAPGNSVTVTVNYQNNLSTEVQNAVIVARLGGNFEIDGSTVQSSDGFYRSTDTTMLWNKQTTNGKFAALAPGAKGSVAFTFMMPDASTLASIHNPYLTLSINASGARTSESGVPQNLQSIAQQTIAIASDLQLSAQALYYASPYGSTGPMPPKSNQETTYAGVFIVRNTSNTIKNAVLTATLPSYVRWTGKRSPASENMTFNQQTGTVTWNMGTIEPGVGIASSTPRELAFELGFTPSTSQIGKQPALIQNITLTGTDAATGQQVTKKTPDVTTNLAQVQKSADTVPVSIDPGFTAANATVVK